jgi:hypothetical protein
MSISSFGDRLLFLEIAWSSGMISELLNCLFEVPCGNQCTSILTSYQPSKKSTKARPFDVKSLHTRTKDSQGDRVDKSRAVAGGTFTGRALLGHVHHFINIDAKSATDMEDAKSTLRNDMLWNAIDFSDHAGEWLQTRAVGSYCILDQTESRHEVMVDCVYFKQFGRTHEYLNFKGL